RKRKLQAIGAETRPAQVPAGGLGRLLRATALCRNQRRRQVDRGPPHLGEWASIAAPGGLGDVARAAANFDDAALARTDTAEAQFLEKRLAVAAASEGRVGEPQQVRDGALDFVESALRAESI